MLAETLAIVPRVVRSSPLGRLKKRLLAACRKRFDSGFESLLCPFFHRLSFDPVPDRSFPDLTISGVKNTYNLPKQLSKFRRHSRSTDDVTDAFFDPLLLSFFLAVKTTWCISVTFGLECSYTPSSKFFQQELLKTFKSP